MAGFPGRRGNTVRLVIFLIIGSNLCVVAALFWYLSTSRQRHELDAMFHSQNLAQAIDQSVDSGLEKIDLSLRVMVHDLEVQLAERSFRPADLGGYLARQERLLPEVTGIRVTDRDGWVYPRAVGETRINFSGRDYFILLRDRAGAGLMVSKPIRGAFSKQWGVVLARRYNDGSGRFAGVVSVLLPVEYFQKMLSRFEVGARGVVTLRDTDMRLIARWPAATAGVVLEVGSTITSPALSRALHSGEETGSFHMVTPYDGVERTYTYHRARNAPIIAFAGLATDDYLLVWKSERAAIVMLYLLFLGISVLGGFAVNGSVKRIRRESEKNRLLLTQASDGVYILDETGRVVEASDSFCAMLGYDKDELVGCRFEDWETRWQGIDDAPSALTRFLSLDKPETFEATQRRKDGRVISVEANIVAVQLGDRRMIFVSSRNIGQRKAAEVERSRLAAIVEGSDDAFITATLEGVISSWNRGAERMLGFSAGEMLGRPLPILPNFEEPEDEASRRARILTGELSGRYESVYLRKDKHWIDVAVSLSPLRNDRGELIGVSMMLRDITLRRRNEARLKLLGTALEATASAIMITAKSSRIEWVNRAFTELTGYTEAESLGRTPRELMRSGVQDPEVYELLWRTVLDGKVWRGELINRRKNGECYIEEQSVTPVFDSDGQIAHFIAVKQDITARKEAENELHAHRNNLELLVAERTAELEASEEQARLILDSSATGLCGVDGEGCFLFINRAGAAMLGHEAKDLLGKPLHRTILHSHADGSPFLEEDSPLFSCLRSGVPVAAENGVLWRADGSSFPVTFGCQPMVREDAIVGVVMSFIDITAQVKADAAREAARMEAEQLARSKSEFLANMSHEIRTPLNGVLGTAQVGYRENSNRVKVREQFGRILESGQLLLGIINDILDLSKIEAGKIRIEPIEVQPSSLVDSVVAMVAEQAAAKGLRMEVDTAGLSGHACLADPLRVSQILANLLSNAVKFTAQGRVGLSARQDGDRLDFVVEDTGIGMDTEQLGRLFKAFEQGDSAITRRFGGTGLGLAITKRLVDLMGGDIRVDSEAGLGTRFEVSLPAPVSTGTKPVGKTSARVRAAAGRRLGGLRVLVADDNEVNRLVAQDMLAAEGAEVELANDGQGAVDRVLAEGRPEIDLVLMDIQMPQMDGYEATRRILAVRPSLRVIAQTAHALVEERDRCLAAGMADMVTKPLDQESLVAALLRHCGGEDGAADGPVLAHLPRRPSPYLVQWEKLEARYSAKPEFVRRLLGATVFSHQDLADKLLLAAQVQDMERLRGLSHGFKGVAGSLMAPIPAELARRLEQASRNGGEDALGLAADLAAMVKAFVAEIQQRLARGQSRPEYEDCHEQA